MTRQWVYDDDRDDGSGFWFDLDAAKCYGDDHPPDNCSYVWTRVYHTRRGAWVRRNDDVFRAITAQEAAMWLIAQGCDIAGTRLESIVAELEH